MSKNDLSSLIIRVERLEAEVFGDKAKHVKGNTKTFTKTKNPKLDFSINIRAFVKRFAANKSGPKKFVLLLAYLTKGELGKDVALSDIRKEWDKMKGKSMLGKFNRNYSNTAKTKSWVNSSEYGTYCLTDSWQESYE